MSQTCLTRIFWICAFFYGAVTPASAQNYQMSIDIVAEHEGMVDEVDLTDHTTYRFYIETINPGDRVLSVFGNSENPTEIFAPGGYFNSIYASGPSASGISLAGIAVYPSLTYDSYVTIGIEHEPDATLGEAAIETEEDINQQWVTNLFSPSATSGEDIIMTTDLGGAWSAPETSINGLSGDDLKVLVAQFTSTDCLQGTFHAMIQPADGSESFVLAQQFNCTECGPIGCGDETACNYIPGSPSYPGSDLDCEYPEPNFDCDGACLNDADSDGICDELEVPGCTDALALNYDSNATDDNGFCAYAEDLNCADESACNYQPFAGPGYCLQIEPYAVHSGMVGTDDLSGYTTYRIYALCENNDDFVSSVSGDSEFPTVVGSSGSLFQSPFGGALGSDQNPALFAFLPSTAFDSYVTIGLTESAGPGEGSINTITSESNPWNLDFEAGETLAINDDIGGGWYIFNGESNGIAGDDYRVLLAQITTDGDLFGSMYVQFFVNGSPAVEVRELVDFAQACYGPEELAACEYPEESVDCDGNCLADADEDGICDEFEVAGCQDEAACNYDADATDEDGSCFYNDAGYDCDGNCILDVDGDGVCDEFEVAGCINPEACNYVDPNLVTDFVTCILADEGYDCDGNCLADTDGDGICDEFEIEGCLDEASCNYDADATDINCIYADAGYDCDGNCLVDTDGDGICDEFEVAGCSEENACNYDAAATDDDGSCVFCGCEGSSDDSSSPYTLTVEAHAADIIPGQTTYRIYQNLVNADDFFSSVFGNNDDPFSLATTTGFYNSAFGGTTAGDINPAFLSFFPELAADSWVTVGIEAQAVAPEVAISAVESADQPWVGAFAFGDAISGQDIVMNDFTGGAWYVLNGTPNGLPDENNRVLIMQITTAGEVSGVINTQVFENGNGNADIRNTYSFSGTGTFSADGAGGTGNSNACGCTDAEAFNYDPDAQYDDGSCIDSVNGCTDDSACNYDADANTEDGSCTYADTGYDCDGNCLADTDGDGICDEFEVAGCTDDAACNYDADATDDDGSCTYAEAGYDCDGNCLADTDGDGICDEFEVAGCTDPAAANYDPFATDDDASCLDPICIDPEACNYTEFSGNDYCLIVQPYQVHDGMVGDQDLTGYVTYRIYIKTQNSDDFVSSVSGDNEFPTRIMSTGSFLQSPFGGLLGSDQNPSLFAFFPAAEYDSFVTIGLTEGAGPGEGTINTIEDDENPWGFNFEDGQDLLIDDAIGGGWFIFNGQSNGIAGEDNQVLLAQVTTDGALSGSLYVQTFINGSPANEVRTLLDIEEACVAPGGPEVCEFPDAGYDCDGNCIADADGDGICDEFEVAGCSDDAACNYDADATDDDGSCTYADTGYDCDGNCLADTDEDGICDEFEVAGCSDDAACNYDADATDEDGSCFYNDAGYDCDGNCLADTDEDGICDEFESAGCTEENACNYDAAATDDDGSCVFCGCEEGGDDSSSPYTLTVEAHAADIIPGQTTYRIYQNLVNADDFFSSVFGNNDDPFSLATTTGFYNSAFGGTTAGDINPAFLSFFPELAADSWVTVGIEAQAVAPEVAISAVESADQPWVGAFAFGDAISGQDIVMNDFTGGAWYVLNGTPNGLPDENNRVLIMQITTAGEVSGVINTQVFENGNGNADIRNTYSFSGTGTFSADGAGGTGNSNACGCTDAEAFNYDPDAQYDDGSCIDSVNGCTDDSACNYDADANTEDGSCTYADTGYDCDGNCLADTDGDGICDEFEVAGCTDDAACNYDADATDDDGSCTYADTGYDCDGNCIADTDGDGICDEFEVAGCSDDAACNYDAGATDDDGSCTYADTGYDCDGNCIADTDGDGICDAFEVAGCTDPAAANYDPFATDDDASCLDPICIDPEACNYTEFSGNDYCLIVQPYQVHDGMVGDQDLTGYVTYRIYIKTQNSDDFVSSVSGDNEFPTRIMSTGSFLQSPFGGLLGSDQNPSLFAFFPAAEYDSFVTIGLTEGAGPGEGTINTIEDEENPWGFNFEAGQDLLIDDAIGGGWFIFNGQSNGIAGEDNQVLLAQVTTDGALSGSLYVQTFVNGSACQRSANAPGHRRGLRRSRWTGSV